MWRLLHFKLQKKHFLVLTSISFRICVYALQSCICRLWYSWLQNKKNWSIASVAYNLSIPMTCLSSDQMIINWSHTVIQMFKDKSVQMKKEKFWAWYQIFWQLQNGRPIFWRWVNNMSIMSWSNIIKLHTSNVLQKNT